MFRLFCTWGSWHQIETSLCTTAIWKRQTYWIGLKCTGAGYEFQYEVFCLYHKSTNKTWKHMFTEKFNIEFNNASIISQIKYLFLWWSSEMQSLSQKALFKLATSLCERSYKILRVKPSILYALLPSFIVLVGHSAERMAGRNDICTRSN